MIGFVLWSTCCASHKSIFDYAHPSEKRALECIARKYTSPYHEVVRAKIILMAAQGLRNDQIATRVSLPRQIVSKWRKRYFEEGLEGLENLPRAGRPPSFSP